MFDLSDFQEKNRLFDMLEKKRRFLTKKTPIFSKKTKIFWKKTAIFLCKNERIENQALTKLHTMLHTILE